MVGLIIWSVLAVAFLGLGVWSWNAKKAVGFWSNSKAPEVNDVKKYNHTVAILWIVFAVLFEVLGLPLLFIEQNSPLAIVVMLGTMFLVIGIMVAYTLLTEKYRK